MHLKPKVRERLEVQSHQFMLKVSLNMCYLSD